MKLKPWQLAVIIIGLIFGGGMIVYQFSSGSTPTLNTKFMLLDVETGQLYSADWDKVRFSIPALDPDTGDARLVRVIKNDAGRWMVTDRDMNAFKNIPPEKNKMVNLDDQTLLSEPKSPIAYRPKAAN